MTAATVDVQGFFISRIFNEAWELFKENWLTVYGVILAPALLAIIYSMTAGMFGDGVLAAVWYVIYFIINLIFGMGVTSRLLKLVRKKDTTLMAEFKAMAPRTVKYVLGILLYALIVLGGVILLIVPGIIWAIKYCFIPYLIIDEGLSPMEAMRKSAEMTDGIKWDMVGFMGASAMLMYMGLLALLVGAFITGPVAMLSYFLFYEAVLKRHTALRKKA